MDIQEVLKQVLKGTQHNPTTWVLKTENDIIKYFMGGCYGCTHGNGMISSYGSGKIEYIDYSTREVTIFKNTDVRKQIMSVYRSLYFPQNSNAQVKQLSLF